MHYYLIHFNLDAIVLYSKRLHLLLWVSNSVKTCGKNYTGPHLVCRGTRNNESVTILSIKGYNHASANIQLSCLFTGFKTKPKNSRGSAGLAGLYAKSADLSIQLHTFFLPTQTFCNHCFLIPSVSIWIC